MSEAVLGPSLSFFGCLQPVLGCLRAGLCCLGHVSGFEQNVGCFLVRFEFFLGIYFEYFQVPIWDDFDMFS